MRILQVIPTFAASFGGTSSVVRAISKELAKKHEVTVYTTSALDQKSDMKKFPYEVRTDNYTVIYFPRFLLSSGFNISLAMAFNLPEIINDYDIIHLNSWRNFQDLLIHHYATKYEIPYVLQVHGSLPNIMDKQALKRVFDFYFGRRLLRDAARVIATTATEAHQYQIAGVPNDKIEVIPNGLDLKEYSNLPIKGLFKKKFSIRSNEKLVLYLGRIHKIKGIDVLVRSFSMVAQRLQDVKLVIAGPDDGYLHEVESLVKALNLAHKVVITGPLYDTDKLEAYTDADVYVLPSRYEAFGMTILESIACGTPIIITEACGLADYFRDRVGIVVKADSLSQLQEAIFELLVNQKRREIYKSNCKTALQNFSIYETVSQLQKVYEDITRVILK